MKFSLLDTSSLDAGCLEESDFEEHQAEITGRAQLIEAAGQLALPIICWQGDFNQESGSFDFEAIEEEDNLLNLLAMIALYRAEPRRWHLTAAWVCDSPQQAEFAAKQFRKGNY